MKSVNNVVLGTAISQSSLCAVYLLSSAGEVLSWNRGARQINGWDSRDITGLHFSNFYDDDERTKGVPAANLAAARTHGQYIGEGWRLRRDGSVFRASVEIEYLCPSTEQQPAFIKIVRDISHSYQENMALRLAQQVIIRQNAGLLESGRLLEEVFSHLPCALILCNAETGSIIRANPLATRLVLLRELVLSGNVLHHMPSVIPPELTAIFHRGLFLTAGDGFSETFSSGQSETGITLRIAAEKLVAGEVGETVLYTALDITAEHQAMHSAAHEAIHDPLTGLLNRRGLMPAIDEFLRREVPFALMVSDIDRFKSINDVLGHAAGDALLIEVAARLSAALSDQDFLARVGGDEFVAVLPGICTGEDAGEIASYLTQVLRKSFMLSGRTVLSGASFGVSLFPAALLMRKVC